MSDVHTFRAATMQEALDLVRRELGSEAVILHTRQFDKRRLLPWRKPVPQVEITASLHVNVPSRQSGKRPGRPTSKPAAQPPSRHKRMQATPNDGKEGVAAGMQPPSAKTPPLSPSDSGVSFERTATDAQLRHADASLRSSGRLPGGSPPAQSAATQSADQLSALRQATAAFPAEFASQLDSIQKMLQDLGRSGAIGGHADVPSELFELYTQLIDADVEDGIAKELISRLRQSVSPDELHDSHSALSLLTAMVEKEIRCSGPIAPTPGKRKVVALVGSTGVGKTTTIAKLAANMRLRDGVKMGLVTVDTYRIAAVEQLRTYAEIIDLPMKVVTSPPEMRRALEELVGLDLILIDTAGRSPRDELQIQELKSLLAEATVDEVHLVMNMTASAKTLEATARKFAAAGTTSLIMTKLDEAAGMGTLLSVARKVPLPISYLTTGQDVPDDIEPANATRMARLILGRENLSS